MEVGVTPNLRRVSPHLSSCVVAAGAKGSLAPLALLGRQTVPRSLCVHLKPIFCCVSRTSGVSWLPRQRRGRAVSARRSLAAVIAPPVSSQSGHGVLAHNLVKISALAV